MLSPPRLTRLPALLAFLAGGALAGCILISRFDDVSGGVPDATDEAAPDAQPEAAEDAGSDVSDAGAETGPGCGCTDLTIVNEAGAIPSSLAVDEQDPTMVYWTTDRLVERCPSNGCAAPSAIVDATAPRSVAVGLTHIAWVDDSAIWVLQKSQINGGTPVKAAYTVSVAAPALLLDDLQLGPEAILFIDTSWLMSCPAQQVPSNPPADCVGQMIEYGISAGRGLVFDGEAYYFIAAGGAGDRVLRCKNAGCGNEPDVLASTVGSPQALAQDTTTLYWIEPAGFDGGAILSVAKKPDAGDPVVVASGLAQPAAIAADDTAIYFTDLTEKAVKRVAKDGGAMALIARKQSLPRLIALDKDYVYWANQGDYTIHRASKCARCP